MFAKPNTLPASHASTSKAAPKQRSEKDRLQFVAQARKQLEEGTEQALVITRLVTLTGMTEEQATELVGLARAEMLASTMREPTQQLAESIRFYLEIVGNARNKLAERMRARQELDKLLIQQAYLTLATSGDAAEQLAALSERIRLIDSYLRPLELVPDSYPTEEHARVAAETLVQKGISGLQGKAGTRTPRQQSRSGSRSRNRTNPPDQEPTATDQR